MFEAGNAVGIFRWVSQLLEAIYRAEGEEESEERDEWPKLRGERTEAEEKWSQMEHDWYKYQCSRHALPPKTGDYCTDLKAKIDWKRNCQNLQSQYDEMWSPGRHQDIIDDLGGEIRDVMFEYDVKCQQNPSCS
ncbi:hypothetical protein [Motilimonas sp. E26]|uniref:hypothetical protein n=1 Tax=Motilimonas sp. E26 TaxID=2865674 RepID=UPI001E433F87|nr:hypothetical protein [Motilimonas sp. E26]MCE0555529.1 hypothetical protein [Motilimonas sp. E26]